jgi:NADPH:quinone reductase-like Zn-dependent oxidoreductase
MANRWVGRKVGLLLSQSGTVAEYVCCSAVGDVFSLEELSHDTPLADAASWFVNPFTALSILETVATKHRSKVVIHTAAASQLGQMLVKLAPHRGMVLVNVVRSKEQWTLLKQLGAAYVICTADEDWESQLKALIQNLGISVAFDAVGGDMTGELLSLLPSKGVVYVYGVLGGKGCARIEPMDLIYRRKQVKGYHVAKDWLSVGGPVAMLRRMNRGQSIVGPGLAFGEWAATQFVDCTMETMHETFVDLWKSGFTGKKLRILINNKG